MAEEQEVDFSKLSIEERCQHKVCLFDFQRFLSICVDYKFVFNLNRIGKPESVPMKN